MFSALLAAVALSAPAPAAAKQPTPPAPPTIDVRTDLKLRDLFPRRPFFGKAARGMDWSHDDRYLAYLWNPYEDRGFDLWVYDRQTGKSERVTTIDTFIPFDRELRKVKERYQKEDEERLKREKLSEEEQWKQWEEERMKNRITPPPPQRNYDGISSFVWANKSHEMLWIYRGDLYRFKLGDKAPTRLHRTLEGETDPRYTKDDSGFFFRRGSGVFRMNFASASLEQLNPPLPMGMEMQGYILSPDESKLMIATSRNLGGSRQVTFSTFRDRFSGVRTVSRDVADDPFRYESYLFLYDINSVNEETPKDEGRPWEIFKYPGGDELVIASTANEPWSPDSKRFAFATWARDKRELEVKIADMETRKITTVFKDTHNGEHTSPNLTDPIFTKDGSKLLLQLERSGYRQIWSVDPLTQGASQITRGDFETYPLKLSEDGKSLFVQSSKEHPARLNLYRVNLADGEMERLTSQDGNYGAPAITHKDDALATSFRSWSSPNELVLLDAKRNAGQKKLTDSHPGTFAKINKLTPQLFSYKNRHGHTVYGQMFLPPGWKKTDRRPLMVYVYGGPLGRGKSVEDGSFGISEYTFNMFLAYSLGFVTVTIDPRGSSGYGGVFGNANWDAPGVAQTEDIADGVKYLVDNYGVDPNRTAMHGWSFGGWQTQHTMYTAPGVITLGIAGAGPTQWQNYNNWYTGGVITNTPLSKPEVTDKFSLTKVAKNLKHPIMLLHGMEDDNVLYQDTVMVYRELLRASKGTLVELVLDPTGGHGMGGDIPTRERYEIYDGFIRRRWNLPPTP